MKKVTKQQMVINHLRNDLERANHKLLVVQKQYESLKADIVMKEERGREVMLAFMNAEGFKRKK